MSFNWQKWRRRLLWLAALGLAVGWGLTWALDSPLRPVLAERDAIRAAAVHVTGVACGQVSEGSGFMAEPGLVVTNAHVVAGVEEIKVTMPDGRSEIGVLVGFDSRRDIAAVSVSGSGTSPVALAPAVATAGDAGDAAAVDRDAGLGFVPFTVNRRLWGKGPDMIYGQEAEDRIVLEIDASLAPGDSGAALVNIDGEVVGMVFAVTRDQRHEGFALDLVEIAQFLAETDRIPLPTPPCSTQ